MALIASELFMSIKRCVAIALGITLTGCGETDTGPKVNGIPSRTICAAHMAELYKHPERINNDEPSETMARFGITMAQVTLALRDCANDPGARAVIQKALDEAKK